MKQFLKWTLESIREEDSSFSWMEEYRYEWAPLAKNAITQSIEGKTALVVTDEAHEWFAHYMLTYINDVKKNRPLLPFYPLGRCFPSLPQRIQSIQELQLVEDMLEISYPNGYYIWYIGRGDHPYTKMAYRSDDSFLWIMDEEVPNSFALRSSDKLLDIKLLQLFKLFDATLSAALFGDLDLDS